VRFHGLAFFVLDQKKYRFLAFTGAVKKAFDQRLRKDAELVALIVYIAYFEK